MNMVRDAVYLKCSTAQSSDNPAEILMEARFEIGGYHRQPAFGAEDDVEEEICV